MASRRLLWALLAAAAALPCFAAPGALVLATTTSTEDSGLLDVLIPRFESEMGLKLKVVAVGTGQALELARRGDADVLLVHAPRAEKAFVAEGHGRDRRELFYNEFVVVGPASDPAHAAAARTAAAALRAIASARATFASRGDDSGTHKEELALWRAAGVKPEGKWYLSVGSGMAETLRFASERGAYTLADTGTFLAVGRELRLRVLFRGDPSLRNVYSVICVDPRRHPGVNAAGARRFSEFLRQQPVRQVIAAFGKDRFGQPLFHLLPAAPR